MQIYNKKPKNRNHVAQCNECKTYIGYSIDDEKKCIDTFGYVYNITCPRCGQPVEVALINDFYFKNKSYENY